MGEAMKLKQKRWTKPAIRRGRTRSGSRTMRAAKEEKQIVPNRIDIE